MSIKLKVIREVGAGGAEISAQIMLPTDSMTFTMSPLGARQLGEHLIKLSEMVSEAAG